MTSIMVDTSKSNVPIANPKNNPNFIISIVPILQVIKISICLRDVLLR